MYEKRLSCAPRTKTPQQALESLMRSCARAERCSADALRSMHRWGLSEEEAQGVLDRLIGERFIDDGRYASAFVREKLRFSGWGEKKIRAALRLKGIDARLIATAMEQIEPSEDAERLEDILRRKCARTTARDNYDLRAKIVRFGLSRGFALDDVLAATERVLRARE